jgi:hypothetical protein
MAKDNDAPEETVNHAAFGRFMTGGDAEPTEDSGADDGATTPAQSDEQKEFRYKGRVFRVSAEEHDALSDLLNKARGADGRLGSELARLRENQARLEGELSALRTNSPAESADDLSPPDPALAQSNFPEWQARWTAYSEATRARDKAELEQKFERERAQETAQTREASRMKAWADRFYEDHDDFDKPHLKSVVRDVYVDHSAEINSLPTIEEQHERLAELSAERLAAIRQAPSATTTKRGPRLEGAGTNVRQVAKPDTAELPSTADWVRQKRAKMRGEKSA